MKALLEVSFVLMIVVFVSGCAAPTKHLAQHQDKEPPEQAATVNFSSSETRADTQSSISCVKLSDIQSIQILDDRTILFLMIGKEVWENRLPYACSGLKFEGGIQYKTSTEWICEMDMITVIGHKTPCALGRFFPSTAVSQEKVGHSDKQ